MLGTIRRRVPLFGAATAVLFLVLGVLWATAQDNSETVTPSGEGIRVQTLAPIPPPANLVDRSGEDTLTVDGVVGQRSEEVRLLGGKASIRGRVTLTEEQQTAKGTQRPVVELARWEGDRYNSVRLEAESDGSFAIAEVVGGRWSARSWAAPRLPAERSASWFMANDETRDIEIRVGEPTQRRQSLDIRSSPLSPDEFILDVSISDQSVDENGRLVDIPINESVSFRWPINYDGPPSSEVVDGSLSVQVVCRSTDPVPDQSRTGFVVIAGVPIYFDAPLCAPRPFPPIQSPGEPVEGDGGPPSSTPTPVTPTTSPPVLPPRPPTSTTRPPSTTTTTRPTPTTGPPVTILPSSLPSSRAFSLGDGAS